MGKMKVIKVFMLDRYDAISVIADYKLIKRRLKEMKLHKLEIIHLYQRNIITNKLEYL
jgi:hypothetical protein